MWDLSESHVKVAVDKVEVCGTLEMRHSVGIFGELVFGPCDGCLNGEMIHIWDEQDDRDVAALTVAAAEAVVVLNSKLVYLA